MLLYAQPASRIVRLTVDNIVRDGDGQVLIWLGGPPTPVTEPFAALLLQAAPAGQHANRRQPRRPLAVSRAPGGPSTQPWHARPADQPARRPHVTARTAALRQLVLQAPRRLSPRRLAFTGSPRTGLSSRSAAPGAATPPATT